MPYTISQSSAGDVLQSSEWDITFLAHGSVAVSVTYTYEQTGVTTTTGPTPTTTTTTTTVPGVLPRTGGSVDHTMAYAGVAVVVGGSLLFAGRRRRRAD